MIRKTILCLVLLAAIVFFAPAVRTGYAEPSAAPRTTGYTVDWSTIDGGGATNVTGGTYSLSGTIGQADARKGSPFLKELVN